MFSLIITIVSIALVVALVAATMYHGGDTLTQGRAKADAAAFVSGAQQVSGAAVMYQSLEGTEAADTGALVTGKYLSSVPSVKGGGLEIGTSGSDRVVASTVDARDVCESINKSTGLTDAEAATTAAATTAPAGAFGCYTEGEGYTFQFKF